MKNKDVAIIGGGIGGLSLAIRLKLLGFNVTIFEQNSKLGGKAFEYKANGYRFDTGPSLLTMPKYLADLFELANKDLSDYLTLKKLDITSKNFFEDGLVFNLYSNKKFLLKEFKDKLNSNPKELENYLDFVKYADNILSKIYLNNSPKEFKDIAKFSSIIALIKAIKINPFISLNKSLNRFFSNQKFIQILNRFATYNGSNPYKASSILNIIANTEINVGGFYSTTGIYSIVNALESLALELGVNINLNSKVSNIEIENKFVKSITVNNNKIDCNIVVSNVDVGFTYKYLIKDNKFFNNYLKKEQSSSVIVFLWGIKKTFSELDIHNVLFSNNYKQEFYELNSLKIIPKDPTVYINISSKYNNLDAPENCENWFILINVPNTKDHKIEKTDINNLKKSVINKINKTLNTNIEDFIETEKILTPNDFEINTGSLFGSLYGLSSNNLINLSFRPANKSKYKGLYFVGGSTHPGGGIPLVLASSKITSDLIKRYELN